jgi:hypothetical protein
MGSKALSMHAHQKLMSGVCLQESLRSQIEQLMQLAPHNLLQPGKTYSKAEADLAVSSFYNRNE